MAIFQLALFPTRAATCKEMKLQSGKLCLSCALALVLKGALVEGSELRSIITCCCPYRCALGPSDTHPVTNTAALLSSMGEGQIKEDICWSFQKQSS